MCDLTAFMVVSLVGIACFLIWLSIKTHGGTDTTDEGKK